MWNSQNLRLRLGIAGLVLASAVGCNLSARNNPLQAEMQPQKSSLPVNEEIKLAAPVKRKPTAKMLCDFADATLNGKNYRKAEEFYRKALEIDRNCDRAYAGLGRVLGEQDRTAAADDILKKGLGRCPKSAPIWNEIGVAKARRNDFPGAIDALKNAVKFDPHSPLYKSNLGNVYAMTGDTEQAYEQLVQTTTSADARYRIAGILFSQGRLAESRQQLQASLRMDARYGPAATMYAAIEAGKSAEEIAGLAADSMREDPAVLPVGYNRPAAR